MAKPPTCRKCGNPHWSQEGCARIESPGEIRRRAAASAAHSFPAVKTAVLGQKRLDAVVPGKTLITQSSRPPQPSKPKGRDKTAYNAYQRTYQAKVRKENRALREAAGLVKRKRKGKRKPKP